MRLILASSSPYRRQLLDRLGVPFTVQSPDIDETPRPGEAPPDLAIRLSQTKADRIVQINPGALVVGADQVAVFDGHPLGKPGNFAHAYAQLQQFSGKMVVFHSALCVTDGTHSEVRDIVTECQFQALTHAQIEHYLHTEQPYDTAGSAKAEGLGIALMRSMRSDDPTAIIGLPLIALCEMLRSFGLDPLLTHRSTLHYAP
ncbi:Maf family nucleotide pyrophosphatase [Alcaligenaceae bacterium CGII-47]|nr:Maf family nucleotide pyrophosphatase [Alcaligenaceae bacterium CGII-47]